MKSLILFMSFFVLNSAFGAEAPPSTSATYRDNQAGQLYAFLDSNKYLGVSSSSSTAISSDGSKSVSTTLALVTKASRIVCVRTETEEITPQSVSFTVNHICKVRNFIY